MFNKFFKAGITAACSFTLMLNSFSGLQVLGSIGAVNKSESAQSISLTSRVDGVVKSFVKSGKFSGTVLAVQDGKTVLEKGYGYADYDYDTLNTAKTRFQIGSITKEFTSAAIFKLQEQKKLNINDHLNKYIKDYPKGDKITIINLLNHTSGIKDYVDLKELYGTEKEPYTPEKLINTFKNKPFNFEPGTKFKYSTSEYILLGYIIEKVSGKTYKQFMTDNFFVPLGLKNTGYEDYDTIVKDRALGYQKASKNLKRVYLDISVAYAGGGLYSTVEDLYKWNKYFLTLKNIYNTDESKIAVKLVNGDGPQKVGCGYFINYYNIGTTNIKFVYHPGHINGYMSNNLIFPDYNTQLIILSNFDDASIADLSIQLSVALLADKLKVSGNDSNTANTGDKTQTTNAVPLINLDAFAGNYLISGVNINAKVSKKGNGLFVDVDALGSGNLDFKGQNGNIYTFKNDEKNIAINFTVVNNQVQDATVTAFGQSLKAVKLVDK